MADAKAIRRYQAGIERSLALFDATNEWADYIAFLSRLLKSIQDPPPQAEIPLKQTIARQLALCLRPSLPSGVHQKALEVYALIFSIAGVDGLAKDLPLFLSGLLHTLSFASLSTRPQFLAIYDDHILALPSSILRPALKALIIALLPGIEEETSEDFERTLSTFNRLRDKFAEDSHEEVFWQNLFLASITSPLRRAGVLVYLVRNLPKLAPAIDTDGTVNGGQGITNAMKAVTTPEPGLLIRCFATGLQDPQPLVQRGFLDLLVARLPLNAYIFADHSHITDLDVLVSSSSAVVLRRDMSLNRRLWTWFTGSETQSSSLSNGETAESPISPTGTRNNNQNAKYFSTFGLQSMIRSMTTMLSNISPEPSSRARPFRIALSLMDRWEIGGPVVEALFVPLLKSLQLYQATAPSQDAFDEVFRSANVFFDGVESRLIARQILTLLNNQDPDLVDFIINNFSLEEDDLIRNHVPAVCLFIVKEIKLMLESESTVNTRSDSKLNQFGKILEELLLLVPAGAFHDLSGEPASSTGLQNHVLDQYTKIASIPSSIEPILPPEKIVSALLEGTFECLRCILNGNLSDKNLTGSIFASMDQCIALANGFNTLKRIQFLHHLLASLQNTPSEICDSHYQIVRGSVKLVATLHLRDPLQEVLKSDDLCALIPFLVRRLWQFLHPSTPQYHVEAVESIWQLHVISRKFSLVESTLMALLSGDSSSAVAGEMSIQRFSTIWVHSRTASKQIQVTDNQQRSMGGDEILDLLETPLLLIIDTTNGNISSDPCSQWIQSLNTLNTLFGVTIASIPGDRIDTQATSLSLQRLNKLILLAKSNEAQWKAFCGKSGHYNVIVELCLSLTSKEALVNTLGVEALHLLRLMFSNNGGVIDDDVLVTLGSRLAASHEMYEFQNALLDTLQSAFSSTDLPRSPDYLLPIVLDAISAETIDVSLDKWITLLCTIIPLLGSSTLLSNLLKITSCVCERIDTYFAGIQKLYTDDLDLTAQDAVTLKNAAYPERSISNLLAGMEYVLARAHHQTSLSKSEKDTKIIGSPIDLPSSRSFANDRLTVVLCMQDALKVCSKLWLWRSSGRTTTSVVDIKSFQYLSSRLRTRNRRILENLVEAEPQECLETLMGMWVEKRRTGAQHNHVLELLQTLDGARPKFMMPATFNAIYNRTNPGALDQSQKSSLSVNINAFEILAFLNDYVGALEDDLLDEIWVDCTAFLKEILANPMPHRQILLKLLEFTAVLCGKMENTNFGEEARMRKELADLCTRLFTAIFTVKPAGLDGSGSNSANMESIFNNKSMLARSSVQPSNALQILQDTLPDLAYVLTQSDRLLTVYNGIATNITGPALHSRQFPQNVSPELLALLQTISTTPAAVKAWKRDVTDSFNNDKFFHNDSSLVDLGWIPLIRQLATVDKAIIAELLTRIALPSSAGMMFGVGATAARTEADRKTQITIKRIATVLLSMDTDSFLPYLQPILTKLEELLTATPESSPSSATRADVFILLRTILLTFSQAQLSAYWPIVESELRELCTNMATQKSTDFTLSAQLQGAKLLDVLLLIKPDEFQVHEWMFVTDTVDAIYPAPDLPSVALADQIIRTPSTSQNDTQNPSRGLVKKPWLCSDETREAGKIEILLQGFFAHLSIRTFEDSYSLSSLDLKSCRTDLIKDLFSPETSD